MFYQICYPYPVFLLDPVISLIVLAFPSSTEFSLGSHTTFSCHSCLVSFYLQPFFQFYDIDTFEEYMIPSF